MQLIYRATAKVLRTIGLNGLGWNVSHASGMWQIDRKSQVLLDIVERLAVGGKIIEFGCGDGTLPKYLRPGSFSSYLGTDISSHAIGRCRSLYEGSEAPVEFRVVDMAKWSGEDEAVQLILCEECINYLSLKEIQRFFDVSRRSLSGDGRVLIVMYSASLFANIIEFIRSISSVVEEYREGDRIYLVLSLK